MKVCTILGTRPEAIKLAPVINRLDSLQTVEQSVWVTGQHRQLLDPLLDLFRIRVSRDLNVMRPNQRLNGLTARVLTALGEELTSYQPDWIIVQGDTTTAMSAALAGFHLGIRIAHVEAGLRTYDPRNPFPEEINRRFIDTISDLHFAATQRGRQNLLREGVSPQTIHVTGNTGIDALLEISNRSTAHADHSLENSDGKRMLLVTAHRRESFGEGIKNICLAVKNLARRNPDVCVFYVVHPNPNVMATVYQQLSGVPRVHIVSALDYVQFVDMLKHSFLVLTDSGGIQEEAPSLGKPVLVLRDQTERQEAVEAGTAKLVGTEPDFIVEQTEQLLRDSALYMKMVQVRNPFGDGLAAKRIVAVLTRSQSNRACDAQFRQEGSAPAAWEG